MRINQSNYSTLVSTLISETRSHENALPLMHEKCRSRFFLHPQPSAICVFLHGFTATPEQFLPIGELFFNAGYNVLIPLLPGHGIAGDWDSDRPPPLPEDQATYQQFGLSWLKIAQSLGNQVIVGGLSGSGTLCAWLALERPQEIDRALLFAPYLSSSNKLVDLLVQILNIYFKWRTAPGKAYFGYDGFLMPALEVFLDMGKDVRAKAESNVAAPMLIISSEGDRAVGQEEHHQLFASVSKHQPKSWHLCFDKSLHIPHNMMTVAEGNDYQDLLLNITKAYVQSNLTWSELNKISDRMKQGEFQSVVSELHLTQKAAPTLVTMMSMIQQGAITLTS